MTPSRMRRLLLARHDTRTLVGLAPGTLAKALEALADRSPGDRELDELTAQAQAWASLEGRLRGSGLRIEAVVRWDHWTASVEAVHLESGATVLARLLRAEARGSENRRRLARHARVLTDIDGLGAALVAGDHPAIVAPLPGGPLLEGPPPTESLAVRAAVRVLGDLAAREAAGLGRLDPDHRELRLSDNGAQVVSLHVGDEPPAVRALAEVLAEALPSDPLRRALAGAATLPPASVADLQRTITAGLAEHLAEERHRIVRRWRDRKHERDRARLRRAIERLARFPPPIGTGAVGVDLDGRTTSVRGDGQTLTWGPHGGPQLAIVSEQGLHPQTARRLLRARSAAPPNTRLDRDVDGDEGFADRACRWVAAAVSLRTVQKLLAVPARRDRGTATESP